MAVMITNESQPNQRDETIYKVMRPMHIMIEKLLKDMNNCWLDVDDEEYTFERSKCTYINQFNYNFLIEHLLKLQRHCQQSTYEYKIIRVIHTLVQQGTLNTITLLLFYGLIFPVEHDYSMQPKIIASIGKLCANNQIWRKIGPGNIGDSDEALMRNQPIRDKLSELSIHLTESLNIYRWSRPHEGRDTDIIPVIEILQDLFDLTDGTVNHTFNLKVH